MIRSQYNFRLALSTAQAVVIVLCFQSLPLGKGVRAWYTAALNFSASVIRAYLFGITSAPALRNISVFLGVQQTLTAHRFASLLSRQFRIRCTFLAHIRGICGVATCLAAFPQSIARITRPAGILGCFQYATFSAVCGWRICALFAGLLLSRILEAAYCVPAGAAARRCAVIVSWAATQGARGCYTTHVNLLNRLAMAPACNQHARGLFASSYSIINCALSQ